MTTVKGQGTRRPSAPEDTGRYRKLQVYFGAGPTGYGLYRQMQALGRGNNAAFLPAPGPGANCMLLAAQPVNVLGLHREL